MRTKQIILAIWVLPVLFVVSGCMSRSAIVKNYYLIETLRPGSPSPTSSDVVLSVKPFSIGTGFQSKGLVYYLGDQQYDSDFYHEYFVPPTQMIAEQTQNWLSDSGLFERVIPATSLADSTHVLEGDIRQIYYDRQDDDNSQAVLDITFYLIAVKGRRAMEIEFSENYRVTHPIKNINQQEAINAMNPCLVEILENLEQDLEQHLKIK